jgi:hypothetical protein
MRIIATCFAFCSVFLQLSSYVLLSRWFPSRLLYTLIKLLLLLRITVFLDFVHRSGFQILGKKSFGNWICFHPQARGGKYQLCWIPSKEPTTITGLAHLVWFFGWEDERGMVILRRLVKSVGDGWDLSEVGWGGRRWIVILRRLVKSVGDGWDLSEVGWGGRRWIVIVRRLVKSVGDGWDLSEVGWGGRRLIVILRRLVKSVGDGWWSYGDWMRDGWDLSEVGWGGRRWIVVFQRLVGRIGDG